MNRLRGSLHQASWNPSSSTASGANGSSSNGYSNGSSSSSNGASTSHTNGNDDVPIASTSGTRFTPIYPGSQIDREELVRLTLQCLSDAGFSQAAAALSKESGYTLESPTISSFRNGVLAGKWESVTRILQDNEIVQGDAANTARFLIAEQKFLEYLEARETKKALSVLRNELAPLNHSPERLHQLSSFMMCSSSEELRERSGWLGSGDASRKQLLQVLQQHIPSSTMIPQKRLETLLEQAKEYQRTQCRYHASEPPISLFSDHVCDRSVFPTVTTHILGGHSDEVWRVEFSHDGTRLASAGQDGKVLIWKVNDGFSLQHTINAAEHTDYITSLAWSPDDTMLLLGVEPAVKIYDTATGLCTLNVIKHEHCAVGGVAWLPNSNGFFSGGLDMRLLCWDLDGNVPYAFSTAPYRIIDVAVSPDGTRLVALGEASHVHRSSHAIGVNNGSSTGDISRSMFEVKDRRIMVFNLTERRQERHIHHTTALTCVTFQPDSSRYVLINQVPDEIVLYDIVTGASIKHYHGQQQSLHMIRSCFGGSSNGFVISGSEDSLIYVWHKDNPRPLECLSGHGAGSVNDVAWNAASSGMFASAGDDHTIRIWQAPSALPANAA